MPVKLRVGEQLTLANLRQQLLEKGLSVREGAFHSKGCPEALDETTAVADLADVRLLFSPEPILRPWQLCAAHRAAQQLVAARSNSSPQGCGAAHAAMTAANMSWEAVAARHPLYKTKLCNGWTPQGVNRCRHGARCVYAHGPGELRPRPQTFIPPPSMAAAMGAGVLRPFLPHGGMPPGSLRAPMMPGLVPPAGLAAAAAAAAAAAGGGLPALPPGVPGLAAAAAQAAAAAAIPTSPEVVFTVDPEEERRRAERAKRFAARPASFEQEEEEGSADQCGNSLAAAAAVAAAVSDTPENLEDQIADYILQMQQQFMSSFMGDSDGGKGDAPYDPLGEAAGPSGLLDSFTGDTLNNNSSAGHDAGQPPPKESELANEGDTHQSESVAVELAVANNEGRQAPADEERREGDREKVVEEAGASASDAAADVPADEKMGSHGTEPIPGEGIPPAAKPEDAGKNSGTMPEAAQLQACEQEEQTTQAPTAVADSTAGAVPAAEAVQHRNNDGEDS